MELHSPSINLHPVSVCLSLTMSLFLFFFLYSIGLAERPKQEGWGGWEVVGEIMGGGLRRKREKECVACVAAD